MPNHVATTQEAEGGTQGATRVFDSGSTSGNPREWYYTNINGSQDIRYVVRLRLGRFQLSTGRFQYGEEQLYHCYVYRL